MTTAEKNTKPKTAAEIAAEDNRRLKRFLVDYDYYARETQGILNKDLDRVPFRLRPAQKRFVKMAETTWAEGKPFMCVVLKCRQIGFSTLSIGLGHRSAVLNENSRGLIMSKDEKTTKLMWDIWRRFVDYQHPDYRPDPARYEEEKNESFTYGDTGGSCLFHTAGKKGSSSFGHGATLQWAVLDEFSRFGDPSENIKAVLKAHTKKPGTFVIIETTANGLNYFYQKIWKPTSAGKGLGEIAGKSGRGTWQTFFTGPWEDPTYRMSVPKDFAFTEAELDIARRIKERFDYDVPLEYFPWRRWTIATECFGDMDDFNEQYPEFPEDAFVSSGSGAFAKKALDRAQAMADRAEKKAVKGELWDRNGRITLEEDERADLTVYESPIPGGVYCIGVDVASGLKGRTYSVAQVLNKQTGVQAATWRGHLPPDLFAHVVARLGEYYNKARINFESNNHGVSFRDTIKHVYPLSKIHKQERYDEKIAKKTKRLGFHMDIRTRNETVDNLRAFVRDYLLQIQDQATVDEMRSFVKNERGIYEADEGCYDDTVLALAHAAWEMMRRPWRTPEKEEKMVFVKSSLGGSAGRLVPQSSLR